MQNYREGKSSDSASKYRTPEPAKDKSEGELFDF